MYCIYSGKHLDDADMNIEHIIPLSLGGCDEFTIKVGTSINSDLGSRIDGKFSKDFLIGLQQLPFGNKGHSKKEKTVDFTGNMNGHPVRFTLSKEGAVVYDHIERKSIDGPINVRVTASIDLDVRWRFVCKVALATGYYLFGDEFEKYADCKTLRTALLSNSIAEEQLDLKLHDNLMEVDNMNYGHHTLTVKIMEQLGGSSVLFGYAQGRILTFVAINGIYIGMVNFKADTEKLPLDTENHRCGCMLVCKDKKLYKKSFWQCVYDFAKIQGMEIPSDIEAT